MKINLYTLPNAVTCLNLLAGCGAIERALAGDFAWAFGLTAAAAAFDFLDGLCARLLHSYSEAGKQLDSLADVVSFGAAPAFALFSLLRGMEGIAGWMPYTVFVLTAFSALRLAKFNLDERQSVDFIGLPTPACALLIVSLVYLLTADPLGPLRFLLDSPAWSIGLAGVLSFLLVSGIRLFSLKFRSFGWRGNEARYLFLGSSLVAFGLFRLYAVPLAVILYILFSLFLRIVCRTSSKTLEPSK